LVWLQQHLFPFNYVIPGESHNNLLRFETMMRHLSRKEPSSNGIEKEDDASFEETGNSFSGSSYQVINFIVDLPIRADNLVNYDFTEEVGRELFVMTEFQIVDKETAISNEKGDAAHDLYKERQQEQVRRRLREGQLSRRNHADRSPEKKS